jgi:hypothetical protein
MMDVIELRPADAPAGAVALAPTSLYPNEVKFLYAVPGQVPGQSGPVSPSFEQVAEWAKAPSGTASA